MLKRHENIDTLGSYGHFGEVSWPVVGKERQGMAVMSGNLGGAFSSESLSLYDITGGDVRPLTATVAPYRPSGPSRNRKAQGIVTT